MFSNPYEDVYVQAVADERQRVCELLDLWRPEASSLIIDALRTGLTREEVSAAWAELVTQHAEKQTADANAAWAKIAEAQEKQKALAEEEISRAQGCKISAEEESRRRASLSVRQACTRLTQLNGRHTPNRNRAGVGSRLATAPA